MSYPQVIRVFATNQAPDYDCPWQARTADRGTGSGVVITGGKILTGAHVVANATFVQVQKQSRPDKVVARVEAVSHDCDLALLHVPDPEFLHDIPRAEVGDLPNLRDKVSVVGFPIGGEEISITQGVVSRIEVQRYNHSQRYLLAVTVDAAINEGNSGGPVFHGDQVVVGIAFQKLSGAENIGEMVPAPVIRTFLHGVESGKSPHIPGLGIVTQSMENPLLRRHLRMDDHDSGVMVVSVEYGCSAWGVLKPRDVLMALDGTAIANNGTVQYAKRYRTRYDVLLSKYYVGDPIELTIKRAGEPMTLPVTLQPMHYLVPRSTYDRQPTYFIYGGLVFQSLTRDFLATWDKWWNKAPKEFLNQYFAGTRTPERQEIVVLSQVLSDEINMGYEDLYNESVVAINGIRPRDMADFVERLDNATGVVEIETSGPGVLVLDTDKARAANAGILARYHITADRSRDLRPQEPIKNRPTGPRDAAAGNAG